MGSKVAKILKTVAPIAASFIPGIGPLGAAAIGAGAGALGGGGLKGALIGAATGGVSKYLSSSGALGNLLGSAGKLVQGPATAAQVAGAGSTNAALSNLSSPIAKALSGAGSANGVGGGASLFSPSSLGNIYSAYNSSKSQDEMEKQLLAAQGKSEAAYSPYLSAGKTATNQLSQNLTKGFDATDLENDPGYQFNLAQGQQALDRSQAARGNYFSGQALKEAQEFGQGLADNTYNTAFGRRATENQQLAGLSGQGANTAANLSNVYDNQGNIRANNTLAQSNLLSSTLSNVLRGSGARQIVGYNSDGTPIYADDKTASAVA